MDFRHSGFAIATFAVIGVLIVGAFGAFLGGGVAELVRARGYAPTAGVMTRFDLHERQGRRGPEWTATVEYEYEAAGTKRTGSRLTAFDDGLANRVRWFAGPYAPGTPVTVWYNPDNPDVCILDRRLLTGEMFFVLLWLMVLGCAFTFWADALDAMLWRARRRPAGGVFLRYAGDRIHVRLPRYPPVVAAAITLFAAGMAVMIGWLVRQAFRLPDPFFPAWEGWVAAGAVLVPGLPVYAWCRYTTHTGRRDMVVNIRSGLISLPRTFGRRGVKIIPISAVDDVTVEIHEHENHTQYGTYTTYTHLPTLVWQPEDGRRTTETLAEWRDSGKAFAFAKWLRGQLVAAEMKDGKKRVGRGAAGMPSVLEGLYGDGAPARR